MINLNIFLKSTILVFTLTLISSNLAFAVNKEQQVKKINIEITSHLGDKQSFFKDDVIKFLINLDVDAYLVVIYQTANNQLIQLLPNQKEKSTLYKAGLFINVPSENVPYKFTIQSPYGKEKVWVFASDKSGVSLTGKILSNGLKIVSTPIQKIREQIKAYSNLYFGQSSYILYTKDK